MRRRPTSSHKVVYPSGNSGGTWDRTGRGRVSPSRGSCHPGLSGTRHSARRSCVCRPLSRSREKHLEGMEGSNHEEGVRDPEDVVLVDDQVAGDSLSSITSDRGKGETYRWE